MANGKNNSILDQIRFHQSLFAERLKSRLHKQSNAYAGYQHKQSPFTRAINISKARLRGLSTQAKPVYAGDKKGVYNLDLVLLGLSKALAFLN
jgi:outer membrane receptor for ferrienterochelin and colicin